MQSVSLTGGRTEEDLGFWFEMLCATTGASGGGDSLDPPSKRTTRSEDALALGECELFGCARYCWTHGWESIPMVRRANFIEQIVESFMKRKTVDRCQSARELLNIQESGWGFMDIYIVGKLISIFPARYKTVQILDYSMVGKT